MQAAIKDLGWLFISYNEETGQLIFRIPRE